MTKMVRITEGTFWHKPVTGEFELVRDYKAAAGNPENRRNGRGGAGYITINPNGAFEVGGKRGHARITVQGEGVGYEVFETAAVVTETQEALVAVAEVASAEAVAEIPAQEPAQEQSAVDALLGAVFADEEPTAETVAEVVESTPDVTDELAELEAQFEAASGKERDALRKKLARRRAKLQA